MRRCDVLRVFTRGDRGGNHLGVVTDLAGLDGAGMQCIATGLGFSETIFIDRGTEPIPEVRIFTPAVELAFAGHPLVGAAWTLGAPGGEGTLRCGAGPVAYSAQGDRAAVELPLSGEVAPAAEGASIARAIGLEEPDGAWWAEMPIPYLVLHFGDAEMVASARPDPEALAGSDSPEAIYLIAPVGVDRVRARFFAPRLGVFEDPATGSAAAALAAVRAFEGVAAGEATILQGDEIGHPSTIEVAWRGGLCRLAGTVRAGEARELDR